MLESLPQCRWETDRPWETQCLLQGGDEVLTRRWAWAPGLSPRSHTQPLSGDCGEGCGCNYARCGFARRRGWDIWPSWQQIPTELGTPITRHPHSSGSPVASSLGWRQFIEKDVLLLCSDSPGVLLQETLEWETFQILWGKKLINEKKEASNLTFPSELFHQVTKQ